MKVISFYTYLTIDPNSEQICGVFDFQFAHPPMRFLAAGAPAMTQFRQLRARGIGGANWVTIIPAIPPIAASHLSSSRSAREYLQDDPRP